MFDIAGPLRFNIEMRKHQAKLDQKLREQVGDDEWKRILQERETGRRHRELVGAIKSIKLSIF